MRGRCGVLAMDISASLSHPFTPWHRARPEAPLWQLGRRCRLTGGVTCVGGRAVCTHVGAVVETWRTWVDMLMGAIGVHALRVRWNGLAPLAARALRCSLCR